MNKRMEFSYDELTIITIILNLQVIALYQLRQLHQAQQEAKCKRRRRHSVHPLWQSRDTKGEPILIKQMLMDKEEKFYRYFHISRFCFATILWKIEGQMLKKCTHWKTPIAPEEQLAVCLRYLVTGDSLKTISYSFRMDSATVHQIVVETCKVITRVLLTETLPTPNMEMWEKIKQQFWEKCQFPNCLGAIDGKHVNIQVPSNLGSLHVNYKNTHSVVLMAVADANSNFIAVNVGAFRKNSDVEIFAQSQLGRALNDGTYRMLPDTNLPGTSICAPCVIVANEAFPLKRNLLRPYPEQQAEGNEDRTYFNTRLSITRRVVENAFEILAQKFRIYNRRIQTKPENADCIIMATCVLHNFMRSYEKSRQKGRKYDLPQKENAQSATWNTLNHHGGDSTRESFDVRDKFKDYIFASRSSHTGAT